ncbi:tryptophan--tRNA ligase [uncultured Oscillibacter sp.]|uniref:tryptophan--tRNA ligase n=1 Tax=uncultured Oscillibacter sp. TaxID=876091 RepID=UPI0025DFC799|nr:tryptophan--tRNA ligase [uncultured Oscillibacter sp.]
MENETQKKRILSGIQPSGDLTLGSYLGAIRNWAALADEYDCYYMLADMHTITVRQVPADLRRHTLTQLAAYIACGLDPQKNTLFVQSHVPAHAQLGWVLDCYTMFGELSRMTQFKDKSAKNADNINAGLFTYPSLMAADILLYQADLVPVGGDQKQHVEICRDIATRFNGIYGDVFKLPEPYIPKVGARIMSLTSPDSKMSKSDKDPNGCVYMLEKPEDILRKFKKAVTDSEACVRYDPKEKPGVSNLMQIYSVCTGRDFAAIETEFAGHGYGDFKAAVGEAVVELLRPIREETDRLLADKAGLQAIYRDGAERAARVANRTLGKVYKKIGFIDR